MKIYVASKSNNKNYALDPDSIIAACATGPNPLMDAKSYAKGEVQAEESPVYLYEVELKAIGSYKLHKEVVFAAPAT